MTLIETQDAIDAEYLTYEALMIQRQDAFFAVSGVYFQALPTSTTIPADGSRVVPDRLEDMPHDQPIPWPVEVFPEDLPAQMAIDVYQEAQGWGYMVSLRHIWSGSVYERQINYNGSRADQPWAIFVDLLA